MKFKSKLKLGVLYIVALIFHILVLAFWLFIPKSIMPSDEMKNFLSLTAIITFDVFILLLLTLKAEKYYAYFDRISAKNAFREKSIKYSSIQSIKEKEKHFIIYYRNEQGNDKKLSICCDNQSLLLDVIKRERIIKNR